MGHVPYVYLPGPWTGDAIAASRENRHHLERVLRLRNGDPVEYTDGAGRVGAGSLGVDGMVLRGTEQRLPRPAPEVCVAVAPPHRTERLRFMVEKLAELGVDRLRWLETSHGRGRLPATGKIGAWTVSALEQSRGTWLMEIDGPNTVGEVVGGGGQRVVVADPDAPPIPPMNTGDLGGRVTILVGPEGGWSPGEIPDGVAAFSLGPRILRTETAAIVAATLFLQVTGRFGGSGQAGD